MPSRQKDRLIPGLGPKSTAALDALGIRTLEQLKQRDLYRVYAKLKARDRAVSLNFLYGMIAAVEGVHWRDVQRERRTEILLRLDELGLAPK
jgi:DNA transformation protein